MRLHFDSRRIYAYIYGTSLVPHDNLYLAPDHICLGAIRQGIYTYENNIGPMKGVACVLGVSVKSFTFFGPTTFNKKTVIVRPSGIAYTGSETYRNYLFLVVCLFAFSV